MFRAELITNERSGKMPRRLKNGTQVYLGNQACAVVNYNPTTGEYQLKVQGKDERVWTRDFTEGTSSSSHRSSRSELPSYRRTSTSPARDEKIYYQELPEALDSDGKCVVCGRLSNPKRTIHTEDEGTKQVIKCTYCSQLMRPVSPRRRSILDL